MNQPANAVTPDAEFERRWALTVLDEALAALRQKHAARGKAALFAGLSGYLSLDGGDAAYDQTAQALGMTPGAIKVAVHRLRHEYREQLRLVVAATVRDEADVPDELETLLKALSV